MSNDTTNQQHDLPPEGADEVLALLLKAAGSREAPPADAYEQVLGAATETWRGRLHQRRRRIFTALAASIAALAVISVALLQSPGSFAPGLTVAMTDTVVGTTMVRKADASDWTWLDSREITQLEAGMRLRTGPDSGAGILRQDGSSLRVDQRSEIEFQGANRILLSAGAVYFDSGAADGAADGFEIVTRDSRVRHIGTQFEVRLGEQGSRIRVREGRVLISTRFEEIESTAGDELTIVDRRPLQRAQIAADHPDWAWVQVVAPAAYSQDQPLSKLLEWVARETGRQIHFARPELADRADSTILHGSSQRLLPMEALAVMLQTTDFQYLVTGGSEILIDAETP